jgi:hypothetical protein
MNIVVLDTGTLGLLTHPRARPDAVDCRRWAQALLFGSTRLIIPGIAEYELRRELVRAGKTLGLRRLDLARAGFEFDPISQAVLDKAAELWAAVRNAGLTTAHPAALDGDAILAAQTILAGGPGGRAHNFHEQSRSPCKIPWYRRKALAAC